jgi:hypothetical protein
MSALGGTLFLITQIPLAQGIALDLSLIAVFLVGIYAGPRAGLLTGLIAGLIPGIVFGPLSPVGSILAIIAIPIGKGLTGLTIGLLAPRFNPKNNNILGIPLTLVSYIPEGLFTCAYFLVLLPLFVGSSIGTVVLYGIMTKAIGEVVIMSLIVSVLVSNKAINNFIENYFGKTQQTTKQ